MKTERIRIHKVSIDLFDWEQDGKDYAVILTINEAKLADTIFRAIGRHDGKTELAGGGIVIEVTESKAGKGESHG